MIRPRNSGFSNSRLFALAAALATISAGGPARAGSWLDDARYGQIGTNIAPYAHAEPFAPVRTEHETFDTRGYALRHGFDVHELDTHAFVPLNKGGLFNYQPDAWVVVPPQPGSHRALATIPLRLHSNPALYGTQPMGPLAPTDTPLRGGLSPRSIDVERR
jgi:hypothetical protein